MRRSSESRRQENNRLWQQELQRPEEGPDEATRQALAASSAKEASAVSNAKEVLVATSTKKASTANDVDVVEKNQMGGENYCC